MVESNVVLGVHCGFALSEEALAASDVNEFRNASLNLGFSDIYRDAQQDQLKMIIEKTKLLNSLCVLWNCAAICCTVNFSVTSTLTEHVRHCSVRKCLVS